ncbi:centromere protein O isoform X3 [Osmerus eperlanus]|uniref:centromere protein O isoform X3 n=1 Tax=Osmerus eperlanus TaxID=29151 RepID=UPI002E137C07
MLEMQANNHRHNKGAEPLYDQRDRQKTKIEVNRTLKMRDRMDKVSPFDGAIDDDPENTQLLQLMARHSQLKDLLQAHHLIGGYDVTQTRNGKGVCVSLATSYEGVYLETYNLDVDLSASMKICRHNIPPFIPLERLSEQSHLQTDVRAFLDTLSQHLNAYVGRKQQLGIVKKLHKSVEYGDLTRCLPTHASVEAEDKVLPDSLQLEKYRALLLEFPVHTALQTMLKMGMIL